MNNIAYIPIDIPKYDLENIVDNYNFCSHHLYPDAWDCLPVCGKTGNWSQSAFYKAYENRYEPGKVNWNVPELKQILEHYPGEVTHAQVLNQKAAIVAHKDTPILRKQPEPNGFKILLNNALEKSFYVKIKGKRIHIELPETTNCFAINEHDILHGATMPKNKKYIVSCFGIIDDAKHKDLITRSIKKYGDHAIHF